MQPTKLLDRMIGGGFYLVFIGHINFRDMGKG